LCRGSFEELADNWKEIAWNGVGFRVPEEWEIGQMGIRHLTLEDNWGPAMEIKWAPVKGKFSHRSHLKRLIAVQTGGLKKTIQEWSVPARWEKALSGFQFRGFSWQGETQSGRGVILYCPVCRKAALIQFFLTESTRQEAIPLRVLQTFQDHRSDDQTVWSVFDIRAVIPANFKHVRHSFKPGNYELAFEHRRQKVILYRWAPATALLADRDLMGFGRTIIDFRAADPVEVMLEDRQMLEWKASPRIKWVSRFLPRPSYHGLRLWHLPEKNRVLGVKMQSKRALDIRSLDRICVDYESI